MPSVLSRLATSKPGLDSLQHDAIEWSVRSHPVRERSFLWSRAKSRAARHAPDCTQLLDLAQKPVEPEQPAKDE